LRTFRKASPAVIGRAIDQVSSDYSGNPADVANRPAGDLHRKRAANVNVSGDFDSQLQFVGAEYVGSRQRY
jgi:hypothetical protein